MTEAHGGNPEMAGMTGVLIRGLAIGVLATTGVLAALLALVNRADWWRGLLAAGIVSALSAACSLAPLMWGLRRGVNHAVGGYFMAAGVRAIVSIGGCLLAVKAGGYPPVATLLLMVVYYFAVLGVESVILARTLWSAK